MTDRQRIIDIILNARLVKDTSISDLAKRGDIDAQIAMYEGAQGNMREAILAGRDALHTAGLSTIEWLEGQAMLIFSMPLPSEDSTPEPRTRKNNTPPPSQ